VFELGKQSVVEAYTSVDFLAEVPVKGMVRAVAAKSYQHRVVVVAAKV
jgi:hypothetical protein